MKATDIAAYALCALMLPVLHDALRADDPAPGWQQVRLRAGNTLEGRVVKRTAQTVFVDIGPTIVSIPAADVAEVIEPTKADAPDKAGDGGADAAAKTGADASRREAIFFTARLTPGSIEEKAREVGESVVHVLCLGGSGSGFVIDDEGGYVVTNYHVVEQERDISIAVYMREESGLRKVKIEDVDEVAEKRFDALIRSNYAHAHGPFSRSNPYRMNYHQRVFRAKGTSARLTFSDWASDDEPGGPVGEELLWNFVQVQPYLEERD